MPRDLFLACAAVCVIGPVFAAVLEWSWTRNIENTLAIKAVLEAM